MRVLASPFSGIRQYSQDCSFEFVLCDRHIHIFPRSAAAEKQHQHAKVAAALVASAAGPDRRSSSVSRLELERVVQLAPCLLRGVM